MSVGLHSRFGRAVGAVLAIAALVGAACEDPAIRLSYRPAVGTRTSYELRVNTSSLTRLDGEPRQSRDDSFVLRSDQRVRSARPGDDAQVTVRLSGEGQTPRDFVVRLDRAGQLATVETVQGVPNASLGNLGISELLPSAAGALPQYALRPGDRWRISQRLRIGGAPAGRLVGWGRLASLGVSGGTKQAMVDTEVALPVDRTTTGDAGGTIRLEGAVRTVMHVTQRVNDGVVLGARARSVGRYKVTLSPPTIDGGPAVNGTLTVIVSSTTKAR
ncbi:MAG: hypothetical protein H0U92_06030 [Actinobacteria bacterium]|nr:hypothetical protein [Actinomycetota bacterium]